MPSITHLAFAALALLSSPTSHLAAATPITSRSTTSSWSGFAGVRYLFAFGDSYTTVGFSSASSTQPSASNPDGVFGSTLGTTASGRNYIDYLTYTYNTSRVLTYDMAVYGATLNRSVVPAFSASIPDAVNQSVSGWYPPYHSNGGSAGVPWTAGNSLFSYFFGINDLLNTQGAYNASLEAALMHSYYDVLYFAYIFGARNFLVQTVPPMDLAPGVVAFYNVSAVAAAVKSYNAALASTVAQFRADRAGATVFVHDTHALFAQVLDNPASTPQTAGIAYTTGYCSQYVGSTDPNAYNASCTKPVSAYFWHDFLHPTWPVHQALASSIAKLLG